MPKPEESPDAIHALAREALAHWGLEAADLALHSQSENAVFRVVAPQGEVYALRVHRPGYHDREALESEHVFTSELARAGLSVPEAVSTREGQAYATVALPDSGDTRQVGLVKWIDGVVFAERLDASSDAADVARCFEELGRLIAGFHTCTEKWTPPPGFRRHAWDTDGLVGEKPFWGRFWEIQTATDAERSRLLRIRNAVRDGLSGLSRGPDVYGMIHADLNANNVLVDGERLSVIDFDDAGFGWYVFDLAVALYDRNDAFHRTNPHFEIARDALFEGYRSVRPLSAEQRGLLPLFLLARSLMLLRWTEDRPEVGMQALMPLFLELAFAEAEALGLG
jgi:Ser/Thr protein kinase RdoA (MazF antagonist)